MAETDCNELARALVPKHFQSTQSDYSKLLFLSMLTQMSDKEGSEALAHSGEVAVGPIKIGPGTWNDEKKNHLREELKKLVNIESVIASSASIVRSSGIPEAQHAIEECIRSSAVEKGGIFSSLRDRGPDIAVFEIMWASPPGGKDRQTRIEDVTIDPDRGHIIGGSVKRNAILQDRLRVNAQIKRDPTKDLLVTVNVRGAGATEAYLPPSVLPPPPKCARVTIQGNITGVIGSGGHWDGDRPSGCQAHYATSRVAPQNGGKIVKGSGKPHIVSQIGRGGTMNEKETEDEYVVTFWTSTTACEHETTINGVATAVEEYPLKTFEEAKVADVFLFHRQDVKTA